MTEIDKDTRLNAPRPLRIGDVAPDFQARSTLGEIRLSDYRGRWLVFFSHPADFTPVCTSEFVAIAKAAGAFADLNCGLLGLSVDSLYSHLAWVRAIKSAFDVSIPFGIVEDPSMAIGRAYGMIDAEAQDSSTVRATYFIDPEGVVQAMTLYPLSVGRSIDEMLRMVAALQRTTGKAVLAPAGWQPGEDLLGIPPQTQDAPFDEAGDLWFYPVRKDAE